MGCHPSHWRSPSFFRGVAKKHQPDIFLRSSSPPFIGSWICGCASDKVLSPLYPHHKNIIHIHTYIYYIIYIYVYMYAYYIYTYMYTYSHKHIYIYIYIPTCRSAKSKLSKLRRPWIRCRCWSWRPIASSDPRFVTRPRRCDAMVAMVKFHGFTNETGGLILV